MKWISQLLQVDAKALEFALTHRSIEVRNVKTDIPLSPDAAIDSRNALSKSIYGLVFDWLVKRVNSSLNGTDRPWAFLGLLDIFGFEIFEQNSFEQLCINFTNEKLQQIFNRDTFKKEEAMYKREGIVFAHIQYVDNQPILDMIEKRPVGLLLTLDDMNRMPKSTDEGFVAKADSNHSNSSYYMTAARTRKGPKCFTVKHYAGEVVYDAEGFLEKNKDLLFADLYEVMTDSRNSLTARMFPEMTRHARSKYSLGGQFRKQLEALMHILNATSTHYIRCIKPNAFKRPREIDSHDVLEQLRYSGVFEATRIRQQGFPFRYTYSRFVERYKCVLLKGVKWIPLTGRTDREKTAEILEGTNQDFSGVQFGKSLVLYRAKEHRLLELLRSLALERVCAMIQAVARGFMARQFVRKVRFVEPKVEAAVQSRDVEQIDAALKEYARVCGKYSSLVADIGIVRKAKRLKFALLEWEKLCTEMDEVVRMDVPNDEDAFERLRVVVWQAETLLDEPGSEWHQQMYEYSKQLFESERYARMDPLLKECMDLLERDVMSEVYAECKRLRFEDPRLSDIERFLGLNEEKLLKLQYSKAKSLGMADRARNKEIRIRELFLDSHGEMFKFESFPRLRQAEDFASRSIQFWKRDEFASNMLRWTKYPILTSLIDAEGPHFSKIAIKMHKSILGYCGDKNNPHPNSLAQELISTPLNIAADESNKSQKSSVYFGNQSIDRDVRDEVFCQLMKQVTGNPGAHSVAQGWKLFDLVLQYFAPGEDLSNYVHIFIRKNAPSYLKEKLKKAMYSREYEGPKLIPPTVDQIQASGFELALT